ncbi:MAG: hypothetical protein ORN98_09360, partial [Alphaproteobacteria bacterium]|nr:hypothetical protein [Alphaproteobacteria bacterium]
LSSIIKAIKDSISSVLANASILISLGWTDGGGMYKNMSFVTYSSSRTCTDLYSIYTLMINVHVFHKCTSSGRAKQCWVCLIADRCFSSTNDIVCCVNTAKLIEQFRLMRAQSSLVTQVTGFAFPAPECCDFDTVSCVTLDADDAAADGDEDNDDDPVGGHGGQRGGNNMTDLDQSTLQSNFNIATPAPFKRDR